MFSGRAPVHLMWSKMFDPDRPQVNKPIDWKRILRLFVPYWKQEIQVLCCVFFVSILGLVPPLLSVWLIDKAIPTKNFDMVLFLVGIMVLSAMSASLIGVYQGYLNACVGEGIMRDMRVKMLSHMHKMPLEFFTSTKTGEIMNRVSNDVDSIDGLVSGTLISVITNLTVMATTLVAVFLLDWRLAILSILLLPFMVLPMWPVGRTLFRTRTMTREKRDEIHAIEQETLSVSGILLLKSFGREQYENERFFRLSTDLMHTEVKLAMIGRWFMALIAAMVIIGPACIWLYGGWLCIYQNVTIGIVVSFIALLARLYAPAATIAGVQNQIISALAVFERIFDYLDMETEGKNEDPHVEEKGDSNPSKYGNTDEQLSLESGFKSIKGKVCFEDVYFSYPERAVTLSDVSFKIEPGEMVAFVGPSGAGKSTIGMMVPRFYSPEKGKILIDDVDIQNLSLAELRKNIGIVTQETYLFHDSIMNNLKYARDGATDEEVFASAKAANIHDMICGLEKGYETIVGERGHKLSGGERQRLAIARVLLKDPQILILDEATSSLDSENEASIQSALVPLMENRTSLVIAHRLSTILKANIIYVVKEGQIIDRGSHAELIAKDGLYTKLYRQQFKD